MLNFDYIGEIIKHKLLRMKGKAHDFHEKEKTNEIKKSNDILLGKLFEISRGKHSLIGGLQNNSPSFSLKSLNYVQKSKEFERIDNENEKIMERILSQGIFALTEFYTNFYYLIYSFYNIK